MSLATCDICETFIDTDSFPGACLDPDVSGYDFLCESCQDDWCEYDEGCGITQEELDQNNMIFNGGGIHTQMKDGELVQEYISPNRIYERLDGKDD